MVERDEKLVNACSSARIAPVGLISYDEIKWNISVDCNT
jgi:hypothetical protein